ncbi:S41 family peptidase [Reichenbachiella agarivorans]|uniref:S41 family peptidase n=1 Tax=Reichenbachiella agarivorans TaxID=2979464 RepID=A0ABY6CSW9_9BACT|nr:S41 family peptidase [Reichenbachiella agarivorans]UXP33601.1 S41 family peptidase [Reichenbachiella agarivorans]
MLRKKLFLLLLIPITAFSLWSFSHDDRYFAIAKNIDIFSSLYSEVNTYYVDDINPNTLIKTSIDAMLNKLDPYTVYIPEDDIEDFRTNATGEYGGIGILSNRINNRHLVLNMYEESPAKTAGLKIGDEIVNIDGKSVKGMSDEEIGKLIKGQSGTTLSIGVERNGTHPYTFKVERKNITIPNIAYKTILNENVGYFRLSEFTRNASEDVQAAVQELKKQGAQYLIFDLRGNPGGLLNEAVEICNLFVPKGSGIVETRGKTQAQSLSYVAKNDPLDLDIPMAVLIDHGSASASEIVSGVIQDYDRGVIIGQKSFGKGLVQVTRPLSYNSQLKVTTAKYYIPSGRCIQELDYQHKDAEGKALVFADSVKEAFFTANNRVVYDGGGVDPDIKVSLEKLSSYTENLIGGGLVFDYATKYYYSHEKIAEPTDFKLSDEEYNHFAKWVATQKFENPSNIEKSIALLSEAANEDQVYAQLNHEITRINHEIHRLKSNGMVNFKKEIKRRLELEIIRRYYLNKGVLEATLSSDSDVVTAILTVKDSNKYKSILHK